jgi:hypothetical protein
MVSGSRLGNENLKYVTQSCMWTSAEHIATVTPSYRSAVFWIQILNGSGFNAVPESGSGKNGPEKYKSVSKFHLLKCWMFPFEG